MTIRFDRPVSRSAFLARRLGLFAVVMLVIAALAHRFGPLSTPDFVTLALASAVPAALAVPLALIGLARLWQVGALGGVAAVKALFYAALPLALVGFSAHRFTTLPEIHDISTDLVDPPGFIEEVPFEQKWLPRPEVTPLSREAQYLAYPVLTGRRYEGALDRVYQAVVKVADQAGWQVEASRGTEYARPELLPEAEEQPTETELAGASADSVPEIGPVPVPRPAIVETPPSTEPVGTVRLQLQTRTLILGLPFDAVIRLREEAETTLVDLRLSSRYGPHDLGLGADLAQSFLHALDAELLGIAGD